MARAQAIYTWKNANTTYVVTLYTGAGATVRVTRKTQDGVPYGVKQFQQVTYDEGVALVQQARRSKLEVRNI